MTGGWGWYLLVVGVLSLLWVLAFVLVVCAL
jgi:hypothetical protein